MMFLKINLLLANDFSFDQVVLSGTGCKAGSASVVTSIDKQAVSIIFDEFSVEVPQYNGDNDNGEITNMNVRTISRFNERIAHKICNIVVNVVIPANYKVDSLESVIDFRGFTSLGNNGETSFTTQMVEWMGFTDVNRQLTLLEQKIFNNGPLDESWIIAKTHSHPIRSRCSNERDRSFKIVLRNVLLAKINKIGDIGNSFASMFVDSADIAGKLSVKINTSPCEARRIVCAPGSVWNVELSRCVENGNNRRTPIAPVRPMPIRKR